MNTKTKIFNYFFHRQLVRKSWLFIVFPVTLFYLIFELRYNANLLDVMSSNASHATVKSVEHWGRLLSGFAVALTFWPTLLEYLEDYYASFAKKAVWLTVFTAGVMLVIFNLEYSLNEHLIHNVTAEQKSHAASMNVLQRNVFEGKTTIPNYKPVDSSTQKAVYALIPFLGLGMNISSYNSLENSRSGLISNDANDVWKSESGFYNEYALANALDLAWRDYSNNVSDISSDKLNALNGYKRLYNGMILRLNRSGYSVPTDNALVSRSLVREARSHGVSVPSDWNGDYATYNNAVLSHVNGKISSSWNSDVPYGLSESAFRTNSVVISKILKSANLPVPMDHNFMIKHYKSYTDPDYLNHFVNPMVAAITNHQENFYKDQSNYGVNSSFGDDQAGSIISPVLALIFSTLGALIHIFKSLIYLYQISTRYAFKKSSYKTSAVILGVVLMTFMIAPLLGNSVCSQVFVQNAFDASGNLLTGWTHSVFFGHSLSIFLTHAVRLQTLLYPLGSHMPISAEIFTHDLTPWVKN